MSTEMGLNTLKKDWQSLHGKEKLSTILLMLIAGLVPLIVRLRVVSLPDYVQMHWMGPVNLDYFSFYKMLWLLVLTIPLVWLLTQCQWPFDRWTRLIYVCLGTLGVCYLLSSLFSQYRTIAFVGFPDRYEGLLVWLAYLVLVLAGMLLVQREEQVRLVIGALVLSAALVSVLGLFQYFGLNVWTSALGKQLIVPARYRNVIDPSFRFGKHTIFGTMYNTNNVGSYFAMLFPLSLVLAATAFSRKQQLATGLFSLLMFANLLGSRSRAGWVGVLFSLLFFVLIYRKTLLKKWRFFGLLAGGCLLVFFVMQSTAGGTLTQKISLEGFTVADDSETETLVHLESLDNGQLLVQSSHRDLYIGLDQLELYFQDDQGNELAYYPDPDPDLDQEGLVLLLENPAYEAFSFHFSDDYHTFDMAFAGMRQKIPLALTAEGVKGYQYNGHPIELGPVASFGFEGYERIGSGRGYIFSRTIPLLKETWLLGYGPDTFTFHFPQNDLLGKAAYLNNRYAIVDKPHNLYLQVGTGGGVPALIALVTLLMAFFLTGLKRFVFPGASPSLSSSVWFHTGAIGFLSMIGYGVAGFFNDSLVSVSPVFFLLLGVGIGSLGQLKSASIHR